MNIWMVGQDDSVFAGSGAGSNTIDRLCHYLGALQQIEPQSTLTDFIYTRQDFSPLTPASGLRLVPVKAERLQLFPWIGYQRITHANHAHPPDLITTQTPFESGWLGWRLSRRYAIPLEVQIHLNLFSPFWLAEHQIYNRIRLLKARYVLRQANAVRVVSKPISNALTAQWKIRKDKIHITPVPALPPTQNIGAVLEEINPAWPYVLFVGRLSHGKNIPGLFDIIERTLTERPQIHFVLIGEGPLRTQVDQRIKELDPKRIHVLGSLPYETLPAWYKPALVTILPSLHEGFARVVQESYLSATPVIATRCGGPEDLILHNETGFLTAVRDMRGFTDHLFWLIDHPAEAKQMGQRGLAFVKRNFDPHHLIQQMVMTWVKTAAGSDLEQ